MSTEQNDSGSPVDDDVQGHSLRRPTVAEGEDDVQGHSLRRPTVADDGDDDVEGHTLTRSKL